jgi:hypothetical protein
MNFNWINYYNVINQNSTFTPDFDGNKKEIGMHHGGPAGRGFVLQIIIARFL